MPFFGNKRRDFSIQPPRQQVDGTPFFVTDSDNIDFTLDNLNLTADLTFTGVTAGTYGDATHIPILQIDQWGRVTGVTLTTFSASGIALETNSTANGSQTLLNLVQGTNMTITDDGFGNITFDATGGTYTVNNGLTENPTGNFQLGSTTSGGAPLLHDTYIDTVVNHTLYLEGQKTNNNDYILAVSNSVSGGAGILATTIGSGNAIRATSGSSSAISANSSGAPAIAASTGGANAAGLFFNTDSGTNNISQGIKLWHTTSGTPAPGFGISLDYFGETISNSDLKLGRLIYQWTDPITISRTSKFQLETVNLNAAGIKLEVDGPGQLKLNNYGQTPANFPGTPVWALGVNSSGNVIEFTPASGSRLNEITGILFGGVLTATIGGTTFNLTAGIGQIVTQTASITGVVTTVSNVTWSTVTAVPITNIGTSQFTYILVDSSGIVIQQTTPFTDAQYKTHIIIGVLCHINLASVNLVTNAQNVAYEDPHRLVELISAFGPIKKTGLNIGANGANLRVNRTSGEAFKIGSNYITDQFEPDVDTIPAQIPALLCRVHRNGSGGFVFDTNGGSYYNDIDPNQYDDGSGVLQSVGGSKWTIQRLFFFPNNPVDIICYYGTQTYNQFSEARANLEFETFDEATITAENAIFLGFLFVKNAATDLSLPTQAAFLQSGLFRGIPPGGGGSGGGGDSIGQLTGDVDTVLATSPTQVMPSTLKANLKTGSFGVTVDGVTGVVQVGTVGYVVMPYDGTITGWSITANTSGSIQFDIWKATNAIPTVANTQIPLAANRPKLTSQQFVNSNTVTGWTTSFSANDVYGFYVDSVSTIKNATLTIRTTKT